MEKRVQYFKEVEQILREKCECTQPIEWESVILEDLQLDSIAVMTFVTVLEEKYDVCMDELDENPETIEDLVTEIERHSIA